MLTNSKQIEEFIYYKANILMNVEYKFLNNTKEGEFKMKMNQKITRNQKGFTLIELIVIISILAVIAAIAVPNILNSTDRARVTTDIANARTIVSAVNMSRAENNQFNVALTRVNLAVAPTGTTVADNFIVDIRTRLSNNIPAPRVAPYNQFLLTVTTAGAITVEAREGDAGTPVVIYPNPVAPYNNN